MCFIIRNLQAHRQKSSWCWIVLIYFYQFTKGVKARQCNAGPCLHIVFTVLSVKCPLIHLSLSVRLILVIFSLCLPFKTQLDRADIPSCRWPCSLKMRGNDSVWASDDTPLYPVVSAAGAATTAPQSEARSKWHCFDVARLFLLVRPLRTVTNPNTRWERWNKDPTVICTKRASC